MKKIINNLIFISILVCLIFSLSIVFEPKNNLKEYGMREVEANGILAEEKDFIDVLFVGDSLAYSSFIPMQIYKDYGITSYVTSTSGQYLYESINYLSKSLESQSPKVIFLETNALYRDFNKLDLVLNKLYNKLSLFQYHDLWKNFNLKNLKTKKEYTYISDLKGYRYNNSFKGSNKLDYMAYSDEILEVSKINEAKLKEFLKLVHDANAKLVLVSTPSTLNYSYQKHNGINKLASELDIEYLDLNLVDIPIDWKLDTRDAGDHLNYSGAVKVTNYIGKYLNDLNLFNDHKDSNSTKSWDESYLKFTRMVSV